MIWYDIILYYIVLLYYIILCYDLPIKPGDFRYQIWIPMGWPPVLGWATTGTLLVCSSACPVLRIGADPEDHLLNAKEDLVMFKKGPFYITRLYVI